MGAAFQSYVEFNPKSYQAHYRLALQYACQNRVNSALKSVQKALSLNADCGPAFLLLQLLFSVDAKAPVVLEGATCGLRRWPNLAGFHVLSAKLMIESGNSAGALEICRDWIQQVAEEITRKGDEMTEDLGEKIEVTSQYPHYTHKTQGMSEIE